MNGKRTIMLGPNNYLGLTSHERVKKAAALAVEKFGSGCSGSRFLNGTLSLHIELEDRLAKGVVVQNKGEIKVKEEIKIKETVKKEKEETAHEIKNKDFLKIINNWQEILDDVKAKGIIPLKIQFLSQVKIMQANIDTILLKADYAQDIHAKMLDDKNLLFELKDSILKVTGLEVNIKIQTRKAEEDNEKVVFYSDYCGSGGRMMLEGKIEGNPAHSVNMGATKKPYKWSCDRDNFPYYCVHTPLWMDMMPREWGWNVFKSEDGYNGLCCGKTTIYKEPQS
jgi:hypothetical protein